MPDIIIQAIGIIAMAFNVISYQGKNAKGVVIIQSFAGFLFCIHFYLLGAYTGALLNLLAFIRAITLIFIKKPPKYLFFIFVVAILGLYSLNFLIFNVELNVKNVLIELLPTSAMIVQTSCFFFGKAKAIRLSCYYVSPCWLAYNIINFSIGGIICECFILISSTVGLIRYKNKKDE